MRHRSPARFLAPLALVGAVLVTFLVARPELRSRDPATPATTTGTTVDARTSSGATTKPKKAPKARPKTYTVKAGDFLGTIAETTGVSVADLLDYNDVDAQSLRVGQKLKLSP